MSTVAESHQVMRADSSRRSLVEKFAAKYSIESTKLMSILKSTAFRQRGGQEVTNEQMAALLVVADQYSLSPFTKEIYAFPQDGGIVPIVGIDGWSRIINNQDAFDGITFRDVGETKERGKLKRACPEGISCVMQRKDRNHPIEVTEWFEECYRDTKPWNEMPRRMLRHKAMIQCARIAFALVGIYDEDEGQRIIEGDVVVVNADGTPYTGGTASAVNDILKGRAPETIEDAVVVEAEQEAEPATQQEVAIDQIKEEPAPLELDSNAPDENSTEHMMTLVRDAETLADLDYIRSKNAEREAPKAGKASITKAIDERAAKLREAGVTE